MGLFQTAYSIITGCSIVAWLCRTLYNVLRKLRNGFHKPRLAVSVIEVRAQSLGAVAAAAPSALSEEPSRAKRCIFIAVAAKHAAEHM